MARGKSVAGSDGAEPSSTRGRGGKAQEVASINFDDRIETRGVRLPHAPKSGFGQFNHPILMEDEI
jgi:hypothetical protein